MKFSPAMMNSLFTDENTTKHLPIAALTVHQLFHFENLLTDYRFDIFTQEKLGSVTSVTCNGSDKSHDLEQQPPFSPNLLAPRAIAGSFVVSCYCMRIASPPIDLQDSGAKSFKAYTGTKKTTSYFFPPYPSNAPALCFMVDGCTPSSHLTGLKAKENFSMHFLHVETSVSSNTFDT